MEVKPPLTRPYSGPYKVLGKHPTKKYFEIESKGNKKVISTSLLKPAYFIAEEIAYRFPEFNHVNEPSRFIPQDLPNQPQNTPVVQETPLNLSNQTHTGPQVVKDISQIPKIKLPAHIQIPTSFLKPPKDSLLVPQQSVKEQRREDIQQNQPKEIKKVRFVPNILKRK